MSRTSTNQLSADGILINGFDYENQAWVINGVYMDCGHPEAGEVMAPFMGLREEGETRFPGCRCYGRAHKGERCVIRGTGNWHHADCDEQNIEYYGILCSELCGYNPLVQAKAL